MRKLTRLTAVLLVLVSITGIAAAAGPIPDAFSTTGYTTFGEFGGLPNGYTKLHLTARGEPGKGNDAFCRVAYDAPCQDVCLGFTGKPCGTDGFFQSGSFTFEEWGVGNYSSSTGFNYGRMTITTGTSQAEVRFGGAAAGTGVTGGFAFLDGTGAYKDIKGQGTYAGGADYVFTVDYTPCGGETDVTCPANRCAVFGDEFKIEKSLVKWKIANKGQNHLTISRIMVVWPETVGPLTKVKLGKKTIYEVPQAAPFTDITAGWRGPDKDRQIEKGKTEELRFEFDRANLGDTNAWDYTILVEFAEGCGVPFVEFETYFDPNQPIPATEALQ